MASINWLRDPDQGLKQAGSTGKMVLLDFSAAPMWENGQGKMAQHPESNQKGSGRDRYTLLEVK